jgi:hypothetical protein
MRLHPGAARRDRWPLAALLLALLLPLQGFAAAAHCEHAAIVSHSMAAHQHCPDHPEHAPAPRHHGCGDCCTVAAPCASFDWHMPRALAAEASLPAPRTPLTIALDRLDRPPRYLA